MEVKDQKSLEMRWLEKNCSLQFTYRQWKTKRERDWTELLKKCRPSLTLRISTERNFYDALESKGVFTRRTIENFRVGFISSASSYVYTVNHKKGSSTFVIITLENLDRFL